MKRWLIGVALTAGWLGLHVPAWGQAPMPEPAPVGSHPAGYGGPPPGYGGPPPGPGGPGLFSVPPSPDYGPLPPQMAPQGPPPNLGLSADIPGAFTQCPPEPQCGTYFYLGGQFLQRQRMGHAPVAVIDLLNTTNLDTGEAPISGRFVSTAQSFHDVNPDMSAGVRATIGWLFNDEAIEITGFYVPENSASVTTAFPGRLDLFFRNPPVGFEGDNGMWLQADVVRTTLKTDFANGEINYRTWNNGVTGGEIIFGIRYTAEQEKLSIFTGDDDLVVRDINLNPDPTRQATYSVRVHNRIIAPQVGLEYHLPVRSWLTLSALGKAAAGVNVYDEEISLKRGDEQVQQNMRKSQTFFSQAFETGFFVDFCPLDRARIRLGYSAFLLTDIGVAEDQINYNLATPGIGSVKRGSVFYHGPQFEFQFLF
jgi:hypothetical protein